MHAAALSASPVFIQDSIHTAQEFPRANSVYIELREESDFLELQRGSDATAIRATLHFGDLMRESRAAQAREWK